MCLVPYWIRCFFKNIFWKNLFPKQKNPQFWSGSLGSSSFFHKKSIEIMYRPYSRVGSFSILIGRRNKNWKIGPGFAFHGPSSGFLLFFVTGFYRVFQRRTDSVSGFLCHVTRCYWVFIQFYWVVLNYDLILLGSNSLLITFLPSFTGFCVFSSDPSFWHNSMVQSYWPRFFLYLVLHWLEQY